MKSGLRYSVSDDFSSEDNVSNDDSGDLSCNDDCVAVPASRPSLAGRRPSSAPARRLPRHSISDDCVTNCEPVTRTSTSLAQ
jgi:hypothetical protein